MTDVRVALLGLGHAARHHAAAIERTPGLALRVVAGRDIERARAFAATVAGAPRATTLEEAVHASDADAVIIALPAVAQPALAIAAFESGKHVLCEKPLSASVEEAARVEAAWLRSGRIGVVNFCYRLIPQVQEFKRLLASGACGEISLIQADWVLGSRLNPDLSANWKAYSEQGGGILQNYAVHVFDYLFHDCPRVDVLAACTGLLFPDRPGERGGRCEVTGEERAAVLLDAGCPVFVNLSLISALPTGHRVVVQGSKGTLELANHAVASPGGPFTVTCRIAGADASIPLRSDLSVADDHSLVALFARTTGLFAQAIRSGDAGLAPSIADGVKAGVLASRAHALAAAARPVPGAEAAAAGARHPRLR